MSRKYNFCAGPAALPEAVLAQAQVDMLDWHGAGASIMELSHRGEEFTQVAQESEQDLRELLAIPDNYKVLFMQGGASSQFAAIPLNLLGNKTEADYIQTGIWGEKAIEEAARYCNVNVAYSSASNRNTSIAEQSTWQLNKNAAYVHYTPNETIGGIEFDYIPDVNGVPLVADYSSSILSRKLDVSKFGLIYAGAQKNIGPAGLVVAIIRDDLLDRATALCPTMFKYSVMAKNDSKYNTPATFAWYLTGLVFKWLKAQGGVEAMAEINLRKAAKLYQAIDQSSFYSNPIEPRFRSIMNVPFALKDEALNALFLTESVDNGLLSLAGHRSVGGMRASIYNAVPEEGVDKLISFMKYFESTYAKV